MISFKQYLEEQRLDERILSIGFKDEHEPFREKHRQEIHDMIRNAYASIDGYAGQPSGSAAESNAIHDDISKSLIKATVRNGKVTAVNLYKPQHGRKSIASATDGTQQGKQDFMRTKIEDHELKRAWGEISGKMTHIHAKIGTPDIPASRAKELLNKDVTAHPDGVHYDRAIGGHMHTKKMVGHPKI